MKFDCIIGNPPYQEEAPGESSSDDPIYHEFYELAYEHSQVSCIVSPARFLFNAGKTPKPWNKKMLNDEHVKVCYFEQKSEKVFPNSDIKGGIAIILRDENQNFGKIGTFVHFDELRSIVEKVEKFNEVTMDSVTTGRNVYKLSKLALEEHPELWELQSKGHHDDIGSGAFNVLEDVVFFSQKPDDGHEYVKFYGLKDKKRCVMWIRTDFVTHPTNFDLYKVIVPKSNGTGAIGEVLSTPLIGFTDTFISIGELKSEIEAENLLKYIKSKFARALLGVLKITQVNPRSTWAKVPLQDFTPQSDIDWTAPIANIDRQLYAKYALDPHEVEFIEEKVRGME